MTAYLITTMVLFLLGAGSSLKHEEWGLLALQMAFAGWAIYLLVRP
jgi:hypothetical protein